MSFILLCRTDIKAKVEKLHIIEKLKKEKPGGAWETGKGVMGFPNMFNGAPYIPLRAFHFSFSSEQ